MGASGWSYWADYTEDVHKMFEQLRQEVFASGDYAKPWDAPDDYRPASIDKLIDNCAEEGTHSILDIETVSRSPLEPDAEWEDEFQTLFPLTRGQLRKFFDTTRPSRQDIEDKVPELMEIEMARWSGRWIVAYEDDQPDAYFVFGFSGD